MANEKIDYENTPEDQERALNDITSKGGETHRRAKAILDANPGARIASWVVGGWGELDENGKHKNDRDTIKIVNTELDEGIDFDSLFVKKAAPAKITPTRRARATRPDQRTLVAGDAQIPFQDERAVALFHRAIVASQPDNIVLVGDMLDLPGMGKFEIRSEWVGMANDSIQRYHDMLAQIRADAPNARIYSIHGNHEQRWVNYISRNANEVLQIRKANQKIGSLTLQNLIGYEELEVDYIDGWPAGTLWLEDNLKFFHGTETQTGGRNAAAYLSKERETTIYGHSHRQEVAFRTFPARDGAKYDVGAASPGALCKVDGSVPGRGTTYDAEGQHVPKAPNWQQGILLIDHKGPIHEITPARIHEDDELAIKIDGKWYPAES